MYKLSDQTIDSINKDYIDPLTISQDPKQEWGSYRQDLPSPTNLMLFLTLAENFHSALAAQKPYDPAEHMENKFWAGADMGAERNLLQAFGFEVTKIGDFIAGISDRHFRMIKDAADAGHPVLVLMNSYEANKFLPKEEQEKRPESGGGSHKGFGAHWVSLVSLGSAENKGEAHYWEYAHYSNIPATAFKDAAAGAHIITNFTYPK